MRDRFREAGLESPDVDARILAQAAFGLDALQLVHREREAAAEEGMAKLVTSAGRRLKGEPVARILGHKEFWGLDFALGAATLVPRPETEMLVRRGYELLHGRPSATILDLGTGTGAVVIALLAILPKARAIAVDLSPEALEVARANAVKHAVRSRVEFRPGSWFEPIKPAERFDLIVSNPPYIASAIIETLMPEVREFDPRLGLDGGWDGLEAYRAIVPTAPRRLAPDGALVVEIGATQGESVSRLFKRAGLGEVEVEKDLAGLDRVVTGTHS